MGVGGENIDDITDDVFKQRLDGAGKPLNGTFVVKQSLSFF